MERDTAPGTGIWWRALERTEAMTRRTYGHPPPAETRASLADRAAAKYVDRRNPAVSWSTIPAAARALVRAVRLAA